MENSPKPRTSCLSLNRKHRLSGSPKTPIRIINSNSPDCFNTPPSLNNNSDSSYSTPITRKRSHFLEESPSQDCESSILTSQNVQSNILDVGWKWDESPKGSNRLFANKKQQKCKLNLQEKRSTKKISKSNKNKEKMKNEKSEEDHGFYKFHQELLKIKSMENLYHELDSSLKENENSTTNKDFEKKLEPEKDQIINLINNPVISVLKCDLKHKNVSTDDNKYNSLFDDSDTDNLLLELSQKVENTLDQKEKTTVIYNKTREILKEDIVGNDSFDDILVSLPLDDKDTKLEKTAVRKNVDQSKSTFSRYNSMPPSYLNHNTVTNSGKTLIRHKSMPENENNAIKPRMIPSNSCSSSNTAITSRESNSNRLKIISSSLEEIERRRQEAKQRLMVTMQKKSLQQKQRQMK